MADPTFDDIFGGLFVADDEQREFLEKLQELLPAGGFELHSGSTAGAVLTSGARSGITPEARQALLAKAGAAEGVVAGGAAAAGCFARRIPKYDAVLLIRPPEEQSALLQAEEGLLLVERTVLLALMTQEHRYLLADKEQAQRQITILKQQHSKLIEDNFRQYQLNQQKEKEYARKLESEIARQTAELREANARLQEISRLKSEFLANMSHELRTPMNAIIGFAELLSETTLADDQAEYTSTIRQSAQGLLTLINDILDLAKVEAGKLALEYLPFDLPELLKNVSAMFRLQAQAKNVAFGCRLDPRLPSGVVGDSNRLRQILVNLTGNAMKFTEQGRVDISVEAVEITEERVLARFQVSDTGIGIPADRVKAVFEKFTQADGSTTRKYGGTGLGLSICQELVGLMGGTLSVASEVGRGSTFSFTLPMKVAAVGVAQAPAPESRGAAGVQRRTGRKVLLVEDNAVNQRLATILITRQGYEVSVAGDGIEAIEQLKRQEFGVVLMDVQMPGMDGLSATRKIREIEADPAERQKYAGLRNCAQPLTIIGLTAHARKEDEQACYDAGMSGFLTKPIVKDKLVRILQEQLAG